MATPHLQENAAKLTHLLGHADPALLGATLNAAAAEDVAAALNTLEPEDAVAALRVLSPTHGFSVFLHLDADLQADVLELLPTETVQSLLNDLPPDDRTAIFEELPKATLGRYFALLNRRQARIARTLLSYPEDSVGRLMTTGYVTVRMHWTVAQAFQHIRRVGQRSETVDMLYAVDETGVLIEDFHIRELLFADDDQATLTDIADGKWFGLDAHADRESAVELFRRTGHYALPVTDFGGLLVGIVTADDVLRVAEDETTEDMQKMGGSEALDAPYLEIGLVQMIRKRAGWLIVLFLSEMLTATAMAYFEDEIARAVVLALFVPLIISSGGNSGSQSATLVIRAMALGEVRLKDWWLVMRRELVTGLSLGLLLGSIGFLRIATWSAFSPLYGPHWALVGITVGGSLFGIVLWGGLMGSLLPLLLKRLGFDPAASSAPFVATLVDVTGIVIYFTVAWVVLRGTLL